MKNKEIKTNVISLRITEKDEEKINLIAEKLKIKPAELIRHSIKMIITAYEDDLLKNKNS